MLYVKYQDYASEIAMKDQLILQNQHVLDGKTDEAEDTKRDFKVLHQNYQDLLSNSKVVAMSEQIQSIDAQIDELDTQNESDKRRAKELQYYKMREVQNEAVQLQEEIGMLKLTIDKERTLLLQKDREYRNVQNSCIQALHRKSVLEDNTASILLKQSQISPDFKKTQIIAISPQTPGIIDNQQKRSYQQDQPPTNGEEEYYEGECVWLQGQDEMLQDYQEGNFMMEQSKKAAISDSNVTKRNTALSTLQNGATMISNNGGLSSSGIYMDKRNNKALLDGSIVKESMRGKRKLGQVNGGCCAPGSSQKCSIF
ncbi:hypothetical protein FGO68_gene1208 [Halteria grandinella]|uniref:Uncharacterized protein n=1 Tax=Halteria grandinella TaxID=5974 RepID=A0A8J8NDC3_HALGN|nr:hypothetical protein FGO68_gene1208 [Halteria grandinella]